MQKIIIICFMQSSGRLKYDYEDNYYQKWAKNLFYQASKEIIDNKVNFYKKSEKKKNFNY